MYEDVIQLEDELATKEVLDFTEVAKSCIDLYSKKNHDYGNSFDKGMDNIGIAYGVGRIYDKVNRLINISRLEIAYQEQQIKDENIDDTLRDLACYSMMMLAYRKREVAKTQSQINFE